MRDKGSDAFLLALAVLALLLCARMPSAATEKVLYSFNGTLHHGSTPTRQTE
jgi:hypothetical protein